MNKIKCYEPLQPQKSDRDAEMCSHARAHQLTIEWADSRSVDYSFLIQWASSAIRDL